MGLRAEGGHLAGVATEGRRGRHGARLASTSKACRFFPRLEAEGRSRTHSGIRSFLKQQMTSPTFGIMFHWFQFHDKEIDMKEAE